MQISNKSLKNCAFTAYHEGKEWPDNVLLDAIKRSNLFTQPEAKAPLSVCLGRWYDAKDLITVGDINLWQRTLLGDHVDYCAELDGSVCHAATLRAAVAGLDNQRKGWSQSIKTMINENHAKPSLIDVSVSAFKSAYTFAYY